MGATVTVNEELLGKIESYEDYAIEMQRGLTAIPAVSPTCGGEGEYDKALWLEKQLKGMKFDSIQRYDAPDKAAKNGIRPNIVARYKGRSSSRTFWIMSHLDVVPPGERSLWKTDPYKLHVQGRKLFGRGVEDNQQAVVSSLLIAKAMMECGVRPDVDFALLFVADEEVGSGFGADYLVSKHRGIFGKRDMFMVPDGGNPEGTLVEVAEKSIMWLKVHTVGKQCHASMPELGRNAHVAACELVTRLRDLYKKFPKKDKLFEPPGSTFEATKKENNVPNINTIPADDVFYLDSRVLPDYPLAKVKAEIRRHADAVEKKHGVKITCTSEQEGQAAPKTSPDADVVRLLVDAIHEVHGFKPKPKGIGGGTVAAFLRRLGLDAVVYSKLEETAHQPNESCNLDDLLADAKVFAIAALNTRPT